MGKMSRNKGAAAERELFALLSDELGFVVKRNIAQTRGGGADCVEIPGIAVEVKRREQMAVPSWWRQACEQAEKTNCLPILFYRRSRQPWQCVIPAHQDNWEKKLVQWGDAMLWIRENMNVEKIITQD